MLVELLEGVFGKYKLHYPSKGQISFDCPVCSYDIKGMDKTDGKGNLIFIFGDPSSLSGQFIFASGVKGTIKSERAWPVAFVLSILSLNGDKTIKFSNDGVAMITVDSGLATYNYYLPAQQK